MNSNSSPSTSNNMPHGCLFCENCGLYDHDTSSCNYDSQPQSHYEEGNDNENEQEATVCHVEQL